VESKEAAIQMTTKSSEEDLEPAIIPVFPLGGSLLLPQTFLPLNIFEPRYLSMIGDSLAGDQRVGMIQPIVENVFPESGDPPLYSVGCVGRIDQCEEQPDGRYHLLLKGTKRFRVLEEISPNRGYRRIRAGYEEFVGDTEDLDCSLNTQELLEGVREYCKRLELAFDIDLLSSLEGVLLVNGLCAALPFEAAEKQALLESGTSEERAELLLQMMGFARGEASVDPRHSSPTVH
jgi:Lon protease-like protein